MVSQRTCIGCKTKKPKDKLVRIIVDLKGNVVLDTEKSSKGRGAYLCKLKVKSAKLKVNKKCLEQAIKRNAFKYVFKKRKIKKIKVASDTKTANSHGHGSC